MYKACPAPSGYKHSFGIIKEGQREVGEIVMYGCFRINSNLFISSSVTKIISSTNSCM